ncbi:HdeD family acid-resistance protein [Sedimentitalea todarodis]|uniref:DUF308 domain-containing protein n=1 Tax=Sedimentitalea todarodis TaxID=1631240 RepID=A0ABU3VBG6_9RHOB|nr:DUF308 domain-containing protein [Sedimentitalea todarodis]MDU9003104.1 DUF308 domain-containing protein [Sedimentitalea todarodis]
MKTWTKWLIVGVLSVLFGLFVLANPVAASIAVTTLAGVLFAISGGFQLFAGFGEEGGMSKALGIGLGLLMLLLGLSLMFDPLEGVLSLATLVTILFAASGITRLISAFQMRETPFFWPMLISGGLSVLLAGYILAHFFEIAPSLLGILLGIELLFNGMGLIALAFFLRTAKGIMKDKHQAKFDK